MSGVVNPRDLPRIVTDLLRRMETQERRRQKPRREGYFELLLEFPDAIYAGQETTPYPVGNPFSVTGYRFAGDVQASTSTTINVRKNGSTVETVTVEASTPELGSTSLGIAYARGDQVQGAIGTAGTGGAGFTLVLECQEH